ncbi:hypothetical protein V2J09_024010 [Rumex salicifolius]
MSPSPSFFLIVFQICILLQGSSSSSKNDMISRLPGQPPVKFKQYSGYITVDDKSQRDLFYYFVEAETDPKTKPLVLWLNGGPGCSSIGAGAFTEHGPFKPKGKGLIRNNYSWNKGTEANMIYLESPAGVGFSYSSNKSFYGYINDEMTVRDNLNFLLRWLKAYPEYKGRDFFITGESYGGHYVPQLAKRVLGSKLKLNLKGIAIGNPLLEFNTDFNSRGEFYWSHGLISDSTYAMLNKICNYSEINRQSIQGEVSAACMQVYNQATNEIGSYIDVYDVIIDVCSTNSPFQANALNPAQRLMEKIGSLGGFDVCVEEETVKYLNRKDVQASFNVKLVGVDQWSLCSKVINYDYGDLLVPSLPILGVLVKSGIRVLVYSGDQDSAIPLLGTRSLVSSLAKNLGLNTTVPYKYWLQNSQVGGWTQVYGDILSFATIRGASHIAPLTQPERSLLLFSTFLAGKPLPQAA